MNYYSYQIPVIAYELNLIVKLFNNLATADARAPKSSYQ